MCSLFFFFFFKFSHSGHKSISKYFGPLGPSFNLFGPKKTQFVQKDNYLLKSTYLSICWNQPICLSIEIHQTNYLLKCDIRHSFNNLSIEYHSFFYLTTTTYCRRPLAANNFFMLVTFLANFPMPANFPGDLFRHALITK